MIWNKKGGVGKTTLTFNMSSEYAIRHPTQQILVIDLCPHADLSMALLSSFGTTEALTSVKIQAGKSISSYLHQVTNMKPLPIIDSRDFLIRVSDFNSNVPQNVFLLRGDAVNLEPMIPFLEHKRQYNSIYVYNSWVYITSCVRYFIEGYGNITGVATDDNDWVVFIDTNTSFSIFTEMAILAAQQLIIPTNADDFSREAIKATLSLVYGYTSDENPGKFYDETVTFSYKAKMFNVLLPKICLIIHNRQTWYNGRPAKAYSLMAESIFKVVFSAHKRHKWMFEQKPGLPSSTVTDESDGYAVAENYCVNIQDFHTVGVAALHTGCPLAKFGPSMEIPLLEGTVSLNQKQINTYKECLQKLVTRLCPQTCCCKPAPVKLNCNEQGSLPKPTYLPPGLHFAPPPQYQGNSGMPFGSPCPPFYPRNSGMLMGSPCPQFYPGNSGMPTGSPCPQFYPGNSGMPTGSPCPPFYPGNSGMPTGSPCPQFYPGNSGMSMGSPCPPFYPGNSGMPM